MHPINKNREKFGEFHHLYKDLKKNEKYFWMSPNKFCELLEMLESKLSYQNTTYRRAILKKGRLAMTLLLLTIITSSSKLLEQMLKLQFLQIIVE